MSSKPTNISDNAIFGLGLLSVAIIVALLQLLF